MERKLYPAQKLMIPKVSARKPEPVKIIGGVKKQPKKHFAIPSAVLQQVAEFANGGYYIISFSENGLLTVTCDAESKAHGDALQHFCISYFRSLDKAEKELMDKAIFHEIITGAMRRHPGDKDDNEGPEMSEIT